MCYVVIDYVFEIQKRLREWVEKSRWGRSLVRAWNAIQGILALIGGFALFFSEDIRQLIKQLIDFLLHEPVTAFLIGYDIFILLLIVELYFRIDRRLERLEQAPTVKTSSQTKVAYLQCTRLKCEIDDSERCRCVFRLSCEYMTPYGCPHGCAFLTLERAPPSGAGALAGGTLGAILGGIAGGPLGLIGGLLLGLAVGNALEASQAPIKETEALRKYKECEAKGCFVVFEIK